MTVRAVDQLTWNVPIVDASGLPTQEFQRKWAQQHAANAVIPDISTAAALSAYLDKLGSTTGEILVRGTQYWAGVALSQDGAISSAGALTVKGIQAVPVSSATPLDGQVLSYSSASAEYLLQSRPLVGFSLSSGATGLDIAPRIAAPRAGAVSACVVTVTASDAATDFQFRIKKNGTDIFSADPTITHGAAAGSVSVITALTSTPLTVASHDVFGLDGLVGTSSWIVTIFLV